MKILYCDEHIIVCIKPSGAVSMDEPGGMPKLIRQAIGEDKVVRTVHRLDSIVSGLMVYALSKEAASGLSMQMEEGSFGKEYMAVLEGRPKKSKGELRDYLDRNKRERKTYVTDKKNRYAQEAILTYRTCAEVRDYTLVRIKLITGRTHQIRCQFSSRDLPLYGDKKYGSVHGEERIALWSCHLTFKHPVSGKRMDFSALPPERVPWTFFKGYSERYDEHDLVVEFERSKSFSDCPYAETCGFCAYQGMEYEKQLEKKQKKSNRWLKDYGPVEPVLAAESPFGYRNKVSFDVGRDRNGKIVLGVYAGKSRHLMGIKHCLINHPKIEEIAGKMRLLLDQYEIMPYDEKTKEGWLRKVTFRVTVAGEVMVILEASAQIEQGISSFVSALAETDLSVKSVLLELRGKEGRRQSVLWGNAFLTEKLMGQQFKLKADSFFPLNPAMSEKVYETALSYASLTGNERVLDLPCGSGILAMEASVHAGRVLAVDVFKEDVKEITSRVKDAKNIRFINSTPDAYLEALARSHEHIDVLFFEMSRCRNIKACITAIGKLKPEKIICISGSPENLGKDLKFLGQMGYQVQKSQVVDIMPFTENVECVCLLTWNR